MGFGARPHEAKRSAEALLRAWLSLAARASCQTGGLLVQRQGASCLHPISYDAKFSADLEQTHASFAAPLYARLAAALVI